MSKETQNLKDRNRRSENISSESHITNQDIAISVNNISKSFKMYRSPAEKMKELLHPFKKKYHKNFWALKDINLEILKGSNCGIIGQNGAGKSTLLQVITGILQPTEGMVKVNGRVSALLELGTGFNKEFTGRENVFFYGETMGINRNEMEKRYDQIENFADIGYFIDQPVKTYSSGMYVRLAFAVAINIDPDILIIDEALAVGDDMFQRRCFRKLERFREEGKTIIFVSHALQTVATLCDTAVFLDKGNIIQIGKPKNVIQNYTRVLIEREEKYRQRLRGKDKQDSTDDRLQLQPNYETKHKERFGTRGAEIKEVKIIDPKTGEPSLFINSGNSYIIRLTVTFNKNVTNPTAGYVINTLTGITVFGINSYMLKCPIGPKKAGTTITLDYIQNLNLNKGSYSLTVGTSEYKEDGHSETMDNIRDVITFKVISTSEFIGLINIKPEVKLLET